MIGWFQRYLAHDDPRVALANAIAVVIFVNQPFYPLYVYFIAGNAAWVTIVTFISTPFFFLVPALARRNAVAARVLLCVAGTFNTAVSVWAFGEATGVALFYLPCILIGVLLFRKSEWLASAFCTGLPMAAFFFLQGRFGAPLHAFGNEQYTALATLHAVSVGFLTAFIGYQFSTAFEAEQKA